jgi:uncharacterized protein YkwD
MSPTTRFKLFCGIIVPFFFIGCAGSPPSVTVPVSSSSPGNSVQKGLAGELFNEVNDYRRTKGVKPLVRHGGLDRLAHDHAHFLLSRRGTFSLHGRTVSHFGFEGRSTIAKHRFGFDGVSENIASTTGGTHKAPQIFRTLWINSPGHEHNMRSNWKFSGIGVATADDGTVIAVQMYATSGMPSHNQMVDKFRNF